MSSFVLQQQSPTQQQFTIPAEGLRVGRTPENTVQLTDDVVSRHHATLWAQADQVYARDEGTTNGTWLRGQKIAASTPVPVQVGDEIRIGTAVFVVNAAPVAAPVVAAAAPVVVATAAPKSTTNPVYLIGGVVIIGLVVVIVLATALSGPGPAIPIPPRATTAAPATAPAVSPTVAAIASPTLLVATLALTAPAVPPPARPANSPTPAQSPINLLEPTNGASFSGPYIVLRWSMNRPLNAGERYKVIIDCDRVNGVAPEMKYTIDLQLEVPPGIYKSLTGERKCRWRVRVVASDDSPTSPDSAINWFVWEKESGNPGSPLPLPR